MFTLWNMVSVWLEYYLLKSVYTGIPSLVETCQRRNQQQLQEGGGEEEEEHEDGERRHGMTSKLSKFPFINAWIVYSNQEIVLPGVSLASLYFTVLSFGTLMTATLEWKGVPAYLIAIVRGVSAMVGITATILYPILHSYISTLRTGLWSIWAQWCCLLVCVASVWVSGGITSAWMLMCGVVASRLGLWMFDLSVMQHMQDLVSESDRCVVGGVQNSLQSMLELLTYTMGIIVSNPQDFDELVILSFLMVSLAASLYTFYIYRGSNHVSNI
ncbi:hypothetical protein ZOSMA_114G01030 [Zostera marina]|uniref:Solute carrier family 40 member n=1 Tax=Zostera marina TaxID=29655 RepID=A0A0K9Q4W3_ZOSMR|nr:hypothetical protein ZOSMA_114G01030 [Zostera marina]